MILKDTYELPQIHDKWETIYRDNPIGDRLNDRVLSDALKTLEVPNNSLFLDAGCGVGDHSIRLCRFGLRGVGIDISETILQRAQERAKKAGVGSEHLTFRSGCLDALPFADGSFDLVHCRGVLMHIPDWQVALKELCRVVKPRGSLIVFENNSRSVEIKLVKLLRLVRKSQYKTKITYGGIEDWSTQYGQPYVGRVANHKSLQAEMETYGLKLIGKRAVTIIDIGRVPASVRNYLIQLNGLYYRSRLPVYFGMGTIFMARKTS